MALDTKVIRGRALDVARHPRTRKVAIWVVSVFVAIGILLGLVAPPLIRGKVAAILSDKLHRTVTIEQIKFNPYTITLTVRGFMMRERQSDSPAVSFEELLVNLELQSIFRLAPVIKTLRLAKPYISLIRNDDRTYNYQDLIEEFTKGPPGPPARFSLNNIEVADGKVDFDDRPEKAKHSVTQIKVGVPFISSLPSYVDITVKPEFSAVVNGAPFHLAGDTKPFKESRDSNLAIGIDKLEIAKYLEYSPVGLNFTLPSGQLSGKLTAGFQTSTNNSSVLSITGNLGIKDLDMRQTGGAPLLKLPSIEVLIEAFQVFANKMVLKSIKADGLDLYLNRGRDGSVNVTNLIASSAEPKPAETKEPKKDGAPFGFSIEEIALNSATLHFTDEQPQHPYKTQLDNIVLKVTGLTNEPGKKASTELSFESEAKEKFSHSGTLQLAPLAAEGKLDIEGLKPAALRPYYETAVAAEIKEGFIDLSTQFIFATKDGQTDFNLSALGVNLRSFRLDLAGQPEPLWRVGSLAIKDSTMDLAKKTIVIGEIEGKDGNGYIQRTADGMNMARITKKTQTPAPAPAPPAKADGEWRIDAKQIAFDRFRISFDDQTNATPAKVNLSDLSIRGANFSTAKGQRGKATLRARVNEKGSLRLNGTATANPVNAKFTVEAQGLELLPFQPFLGDQVNFLLTDGSVGTKGELTFDAGGSGPAKVNYQGAVQVTEFGAVEKDGQQDLLKWKSLALDAMQFDLEPFQLRIGEITLADFYSRLILRADGKINLQNLTAAKDDKKDEAPAPAKTAEKPAAPATTEPAAPKAISIGKINLQEGNINFSDFFVKPNYSANLTNVQGAISELKPETPGDLDIQARLDNAAPVEIKGKLNPLSKELFLDIIADAKEIELSPMSPYSAKYVGYGIEKGKLSFNVKYKLENRKLTADNKIILNQLTFGEKIESPTATKLPVLLAVALMKDRNGVIDVDLPISGSLDDPQFSVGGIVLRIIINIITKAVTAPFSLIASAFGGGGSGDELAYIEFDNGRANLSQTAQGKIATLAKALNNRPALKLEITGRVDPLTDLDGLKRVQIERKVKAQKLKDLVRKGEAPRSVDDVQVPSTEYPQYLKAAYGEESFPKPRNVIGLAQDLPVPEMEKLMMQFTKVGDDEMRQLANQRAQAVRDALLATDQAGAERLFVVAGKPFSAEERAKLSGKPNRVDFAMK
jgi:flagellar motor protein MotB